MLSEEDNVEVEGLHNKSLTEDGEEERKESTRFGNELNAEKLLARPFEEEVPVEIEEEEDELLVVVVGKCNSNNWDKTSWSLSSFPFEEKEKTKKKKKKILVFYFIQPPLQPFFLS